MGRRITETVGLKKHKCKQCGKKFECRPEYRYKILRYGCVDIYDWFCSWKCIQAYRMENTKVKKPNDRDQKILNLIDQGLNYAEIGEMFGISKQTIGRVRDKWQEYRE